MGEQDIRALQSGINSLIEVNREIARGQERAVQTVEMMPHLISELRSQMVTSVQDQTRAMVGVTVATQTGEMRVSMALIEGETKALEATTSQMKEDVEKTTAMNVRYQAEMDADCVERINALDGPILQAMQRFNEIFIGRCKRQLFPAWERFEKIVKKSEITRQLQIERENHFFSDICSDISKLRHDHAKGHDEIRCGPQVETAQVRFCPIIAIESDGKWKTKINLPNATVPESEHFANKMNEIAKSALNLQTFSGDPTMSPSGRAIIDSLKRRLRDIDNKDSQRIVIEHIISQIESGQITIAKGPVND